MRFHVYPDAHDPQTHLRPNAQVSMKMEAADLNEMSLTGLAVASQQDAAPLEAAAGKSASDETFAPT